MRNVAVSRNNVTNNPTETINPDVTSNQQSSSSAMNDGLGHRGEREKSSANSNQSANQGPAIQSSSRLEPIEETSVEENGIIQGLQRSLITQPRGATAVTLQGQQTVRSMERLNVSMQDAAIMVYARMQVQITGMRCEM